MIQYINYETLVNKYGESLSNEEKNLARRVFNDLLSQGYDFEWLFYAIKNLNGRSIISVPKLMFFQGFKNEVDLLMSQGRELIYKEMIGQAHAYWYYNIVWCLDNNEDEFEERYQREKISFELGYYANILSFHYKGILSEDDWEFVTDYYNRDDEYQDEHKQRVIDMFFDNYIDKYLEDMLWLQTN